MIDIIPSIKQLKFKKIDAFTDGTSNGNPAGYIDLTNAEPLTESEMQQIASELKGFVNEVGFVTLTDGQYTLRYFSSECEVAFCGHATIAILYDLLSNVPELKDKPEVSIHVNAGMLPVYNFIEQMNAVYIMAPAPEFLPCKPAPAQVANILGIQSANLNASLPLQVIDGGLRTLIVPLASLETCLQIKPDQEALRLFCLENDIDILHVWVEGAYSPAAQYRTRVFAPRFGYLEDLATGSGNAAFGYYLLAEKLWSGDVSVEQGPSRDNPNFVQLKCLQKDGEDRILFGGCATTRIDGHYWLHAAR